MKNIKHYFSDAAKKLFFTDESTREGEYFPPGHFHSPIPDTKEIERVSDRIYANPARNLLDIDVQESAQVELLKKLSVFYKDLTFPEHKADSHRYFYENVYYSYSDAIFLFSLLRHLTPKRYLEVGSGFSSCLVLDTNEQFLKNSLECTFIEPYPERLKMLVKPGDSERIRIIDKPVQDCSLNLFQELSSGDILFIDSSHVSKVGSDVNYLLFEVLPKLEVGVYIHFHDIFYPFEYPKDWLQNGRAWNEAYMLRAFLSHNDSFEVILWNTYLASFHEQFFAQNMPLCLKNTGGSLWVKKIR